MFRSSWFCFAVILCTVGVISYKLHEFCAGYYGGLLFSETPNSNHSLVRLSTISQAQNKTRTDIGYHTDVVEISPGNHTYLAKTKMVYSKMQNYATAMTPILTRNRSDDMVEGRKIKRTTKWSKTNLKSDCTGFRFAEDVSLSALNISTGDWQTVIEGTDDIQVYSAYWDDRPNPPKIRILGVDNLKNQQLKWCLLWYGDGHETVIKETTMLRLSNRNQDL